MPALSKESILKGGFPMDASIRAARLSTSELMLLQERYGTNHYVPYPIAMAQGRNVYLWDLDKKKYLDMNATYSAIAVGHNHPEMNQVLIRQLNKLTSVSNMFLNEHAPILLMELCKLTGLDRAILMNTGAEAFETAVKAVRRWAYRKKGIPAGKAEIIVATNNFHGRTINAISASSEEKYRQDFGPFVPGFVLVPFGNSNALAAAIKPETAAIIVEPIQGEGGVNVPSTDYMCEISELCAKYNMLLCFDEVQTGLGRTGKLFAFEHWLIEPDLVMLGKALGGYVPISAVVGKDKVMSGFTPGSHGSTFGGNPLACAVALKSIELITRFDCELVRNANETGGYLLRKLTKRLELNPKVLEIRGRGLLIGIALDPEELSAADARTKLLQCGIVAGAASNNVLRLSPPLTFTKTHVNLALPRIVCALTT
ncbi:MAG: ornithine--oxo-acid transaminase [Candidatus Pacebacteria bacterium]|nr:ornithine--oxo-acid transaminase [Candidatus Paceibacterota bacterium]